MKCTWILIPLGLMACFSISDHQTQVSMIERPSYALAIHGGAGVITKENMLEGEEKAYRQILEEALSIGEQMLQDGSSAIQAVTAACVFMEDSPLFNAGKGSVFTNGGINEMDASIMDGKNLNAGAVGGVRSIRNPILAAKAVLEKSEHVFLTGKGAEDFAEQQGIQKVEPDYFFTERRWKALQEQLTKEPGSTALDHSDRKHGTVGAVALDHHGNLAAATSTGGMTNKRFNRIGDSPIIGAGTYANNNTCAVSSTGHGEYFIRFAVAHDVSAQMEYGNKTLKEAGNHIIHNKLVEAGGTGGIISLDKDGNIHMPFNTEGMYRGFVTPNSRAIRIYKGE
ncbi:MAG: isoaspartyl peptidase/L-asparaginase [Saprospiraceae bacterium]|nr:isoaspartyl peptidase/L-asparaginase [Saprospiraceae bacterium]